ncbi:hypothetical protein ACJIZ3_017727 [Penstemon smallii]|uniref:J domain-containing protein n=1 Tax=Penstemon smallii TaxID=265156 RepID=A0ABD3SX52_9LAMI
MSCALAPSSSPSLNNKIFTKSTKNYSVPTQIQYNNISFSTHVSKSRILYKNPTGSFRSRPTTRIQAFYTESTETLYELLGISESGSTISDIKKAYKQMARRYHPDVSPPDRVDENTKRFIMVQEAYETLSNPASRAMYDRDLSKGQRVEETGEWRMRWQSQIDELKQKNIINPISRGGRMTWGARMRNQR